ncbi:hypothetical protein Ccrd_003584 [Cynara cardunculus var. scolymus]|uniref:HSF-type DNA-binding domain-containing protein n=1 Tax=Cynara cardunculus var. scolymus TaxID=59895 RepID=A0A103XP25_CYNCS|nr:hypothetical protein Ccrd_003584 [Cynara cardunculus var. scolymus]
MDPFYSVVKEEYPLGGSSSTVGGSGSTVPEKQPVVVEVPQIMVMQVPQPMEGLHDSGPPPFLTKVYEMVDDPNFDHILSWSRGGQSFVGFRKIDPDIWEFANEAFLKGQRHILKNIKRRKTSSHPPPQQEANNLCVEVGTLKGTEKKRQKMMGFLAKALQNPEFIQKLASHGERKNLAEAFMKERRKRPIDHGSNRVNIMESSETSNEFGDLSELEELALEMQGVGRLKRSQEEEAKDLSGVQEFDEEFWEELFSERFDIAGSEDGEADRLDFLGSNAK